MLNKEEDVYRELTRKLGRQPQPDKWQELVDDAYVEDAIVTGELSVVLKRYKELDNESPPQKSKEKDVHKELPDKRLKYLSEILAYDAAKELPVIDFRRDVLSGQLLSPDKIKDWIDSVASQEFALGLSAYLTIRLPPGVEVQATNYGLIPKPPIVIDKEGMITGKHIELLSYAVQGDKWTYHVPIARDGILEKLKRLSGYLARRYMWQESQATTFVLTGLIPLLPLAQTTIHRQSLYPALNTMTIKLNSRLSPDEVAVFYTRARYHLMAKGQKRNRPMTKKHLELGVFYHTHQGMKGAEMMSIWNEEHPAYKPYVQVTHFDRDVKHAHNRLVGREHKGGTK